MNDRNSRKKFRILLVNKYHYMRGGDCTHFFALSDLLKLNGHDVKHFSMEHPNNKACEDKDYLINYIDIQEKLKTNDIMNKLTFAARILYSKEARYKFGKALDEYQPDIVHLHNIHKHFTISIILEANKRKIPIVWTLHDYELICPRACFYANDHICENCIKYGSLSPIFAKCSYKSLQASFFLALEKIYNDMYSIKNRINYFICPSKFMKLKFIDSGYSEEKIAVIPNFAQIHNNPPKNNENRYFLYLGRIMLDKGIKTLCIAAKESKIHLVIVGDGPDKTSLESEFACDNIHFLGYKKGLELEKLRKNAWFVVVPSEWYENNPYSIIESFADHVPVIGANIGGIPELVIDDKTGFIFKSGDVKDLIKKLDKASRMTKIEHNILSQNAHSHFIHYNIPDVFYDKMMTLYNKAIGSKNENI